MADSSQQEFETKIVKGLPNSDRIDEQNFDSTLKTILQVKEETDRNSAIVLAGSFLVNSLLERDYYSTLYKKFTDETSAILRSKEIYNALMESRKGRLEPLIKCITLEALSLPDTDGLGQDTGQLKEKLGVIIRILEGPNKRLD